LDFKGIERERERERASKELTGKWGLMSSRGAGLEHVHQPKDVGLSFWEG